MCVFPAVKRFAILNNRYICNFVININLKHLVGYYCVTLRTHHTILKGVTAKVLKDNYSNKILVCLI